eukprot:7380080-Prymnesium_polylepis.1
MAVGREGGSSRARPVLGGSRCWVVGNQPVVACVAPDLVHLLQHVERRALADAEHRRLGRRLAGAVQQQPAWALRQPRHADREHERRERLQRWHQAPAALVVLQPVDKIEADVRREHAERQRELERRHQLAADDSRRHL